MAINYTTRNNPKKTENKQGIGFKIIFFALNFLAVPFSAFATFQGYRETAGGDIMAVILAALTAVLFFGLNFLIMERRKNGQPHLIQTLGYLVPLGISFIGNFTNFYGNQVEANVLKDDLAQYVQTFKSTHSASIIVLDKSTGLVKLEEDLNNKLAQLKEQYDEGGWATNCDIDWNAIKKLCNGDLTKINGAKTYSKAAKRVRQYLASLKSSKNANIDGIKDRINIIYDPIISQVDTLEKDKEALKIDGSFLINKISVANNDLAQITIGEVPDFTYTELENYIKVGKENPMQTLKHAWSAENISSIETITATFFSLIIDLVTLAFIFLAIPYSKQRNKSFSGPRSL